MSEKAREHKKNIAVGAVMVVGGGIGGIQSSLDLAEAGYKVYLVEKGTAIGGKMAGLDKTFPTNDCSMCILSPKLVDCGRHRNIQIITGTELINLEGEPGHFKAHLHRQSLYIDQDKCTGCGECAEACPVYLPDAFNENYCDRQAVYKLYPQAIPNAYSIEKRGTPPCRHTCPAECNVQGYIALISQGKFSQALDVIRRRIPFPSICGRICHHPCEEECNRQEIDEAISIRALKRAAADYGWNENPMGEPIEAKKERIAVIGAGPSGLTAALDLAIEGYTVTLFDALKNPGGTMYSAIPRFRLPEENIGREIKNVMNHGIEFIGNTRIGEDIEISTLQNKYDALLLAVGAVEGRSLNIPGAELNHILDGLTFLKMVNRKEETSIKGRVTVIGGGNVAMDTARTALREGAGEVHLFCLESREEMPAHEWEIKEAEDEGIQIHHSKGPVRFIGSKNVEAVQFLQVDSVFNEEGQFDPTFIQDSQENFPTDMVIVSIGQKTNANFLHPLNIEQGPGGQVLVDPISMATNEEGIFACGDMVNGPASVVEAIAGGHEAAISIKRYLQGKDLYTDRVIKEEERLDPPDLPVEIKPRIVEAEELPSERKKDYRPIQKGYTEEEAITEAQRCLNCGLCSECLQCVSACENECIDHLMQDEHLEIDVGAVILSPGNHLFEARLRGEYGYGIYPNVITSMEFERMLSASGPFSGEVVRLSDGRHPEKIAFIQCVGSRDESCDQGYCSSVCCMYSTKEAIIAKEHLPGVHTTIFYMDMRAYGKGFEEYYENAKSVHGVIYRRSLVSRLTELQTDKRLRLKYLDDSGSFKEEDFDLVVLAVGMTPPEGVKQLAENIDIETNEHHFCLTKTFTPNNTSREGVYVSGAFSEPKDIPETVTDASSAAALAATLLSSARNTLTEVRTYPPEKDLGGEIRIGVFVCHCGQNIGSVVDVPAVVEDIKNVANVVHAEHNLYTCSQDSLNIIKETIEEHNLNRVVVASCTPRTHEPLYQETIREVGLNPYLFEMANIREQISWVHRQDPVQATKKAMVLVRMAVARARLKEPLYSTSIDVTRQALIIGGGVAGMTAALTLARQGYPVHLVERDDDLGGNLKEIYSTLKGDDTQALLQQLREEIHQEVLVNTYLKTQLKEIEGYVGNYTSTLAHPNGSEKIQHGIILVATGAEEIKTSEYLYGQSSRVCTQREFEFLLHNEGLKERGNTYVFIQCVGSRNEDHPYCSRICCSEAIKNALEIKKQDPKSRIIVLYRDIRTYGFQEDYYRKAREAGVLFVEFDPKEKPLVEKEGESLSISFQDPALRKRLTTNAHWVILSTGIQPTKNLELAQALKIPTSGEGFFLEAHVKLRPVDFAAEGIFLCGLAHSPKNIGESITQANAAAMRATTILAQDKLSSTGIIATVKERICTGCSICVDLCPYSARELDTERMVAMVNEVLCQGCGACTSGCPSGASRHKGFQREEILAMIEEAL